MNILTDHFLDVWHYPFLNAVYMNIFDRSLAITYTSHLILSIIGLILQTNSTFFNLSFDSNFWILQLSVVMYLKKSHLFFRRFSNHLVNYNRRKRKKFKMIICLPTIEFSLMIEEFPEFPALSQYSRNLNYVTITKTYFPGFFI